MNNIPKMNFAIVDVSNVQNSLSFYLKLGFEQKKVLPEFKGAVLSLPENTSGLILQEKKSITPSRLYFEVMNVDDIGASLAKMGIKGNSVKTPLGPSLELKDLDGNEIYLVEYSNAPELSGFTQEINRKFIEDYVYAIWNQRHLKVIPEFNHEKVIIHSLSGDFIGVEAMSAVFTIWLKGFPDASVTRERFICQEDFVVYQWHLKATHTGDFRGIPPTGKPIIANGVTMYRIKNHKISEYWAYTDMQYILKQIL